MQGFSQDYENACPNINSKISARPDLASNLLQILIPTIFDCLLLQKKLIYTSALFLKNGSTRKYLVITPKKSKLKIL